MGTNYLNVLILATSLVVAVAGFWVAGIKNFKGERKSMLGYFGVGILSLFVSGLISVFAGQGYVSSDTQPFSDKLSSGKAYVLVAAVPDGKDKILTVMDEKKKRDGTHDFFTLRTQGFVPPGRFTIIDGAPIGLISLASRK
ncbi:MAG: hypothetical protein KGJ31_03460 [Patescibacteria group bacterium]|nr:hypothetical protein [Patescibacteria group bacterium]